MAHALLATEPGEIATYEMLAAAASQGGEQQSSVNPGAIRVLRVYASHLRTYCHRACGRRPAITSVWREGYVLTGDDRRILDAAMRRPLEKSER